MTEIHRQPPGSEDPAELRDEARAALQDALHEVKRVIVGQDAMLERVARQPSGGRARAARGRARDLPRR